MTKTQIILLTLISFTLTYCNSKSPQSNTVLTADTTINIGCKHYFIFDKVEHYSIKTTDHEYMVLETKKNPTENDSLLREVLSRSIFKSLKDTSTIKHLEKIGYVKMAVDTKLNDSLYEIFCERKHESTMMASCIPMYRNIFVFKHKGETVGLAKICYSCMLSNIVGTKCNTDDFGQSGDFDRLKNLMSRKNGL
jgi:hypothetical protein